MSIGAAAREAKLREQANELYRAIGRFVVKFELMRYNLELGILFLLDQAGLRNQRAAHILLSGQTAEPLKTWLFSLIGELKKPDEKEANLLKKVGERIQKLTEIRNDVVHSTWFIGWASTEQTDFSEAPGFKLHKSKKGAEYKQFRYKAADFEKFATEAIALADLVFTINAACVTKTPLTQMLSVAPDGTVCCQGTGNVAGSI